MSAILSASACRVSVTAGELGIDESSMILNNPSTADVVPSGSWWLGPAVLRRFAGGMGRPQVRRWASLAPPVVNFSSQSKQGYLQMTNVTTDCMTKIELQITKLKWYNYRDSSLNVLLQYSQKMLNRAKKLFVSKYWKLYKYFMNCLCLILKFKFSTKEKAKYMFLKPNKD